MIIYDTTTDEKFLQSCDALNFKVKVDRVYHAQCYTGFLPSAIMVIEPRSNQYNPRNVRLQTWLIANNIKYVFDKGGMYWFDSLSDAIQCKLMFGDIL